jgi:spermidine synthase
VAHVTVVETDPLLLQAARLHLPPDEAAVMDDPRVTVILADGRRFVQTARQTFDVVILDLPEPSTGALNRFYTEEFFREVRTVLNPGGILALGLPAAENYWSPELARRNGSIYHTLRAVFPHVLALPGETTYFLALRRPAGG